MGHTARKTPSTKTAANGTTPCWEDVRVGEATERNAETVKRQARTCREYFRKEFGKEVEGCEKCPHLQSRCYVHCGVAMKFRHFRGDFDNDGAMHAAGRAITEAESIGRTLDEINSQESYENRRIDEMADYSDDGSSLRSANGMLMNVGSGYDDGSDD